METDNLKTLPLEERRKLAQTENIAAYRKAQWWFRKPLRDGTGSGLDGRGSSLGFDPFAVYRTERDEILEKYNLDLKDLSINLD